MTLEELKSLIDKRNFTQLFEILDKVYEDLPSKNTYSRLKKEFVNDKMSLDYEDRLKTYVNHNIIQELIAPITYTQNTKSQETKMTDTNSNEPPKTKKWKWYWFLLAITPLLVPLYPLLISSDKKPETKEKNKQDCPQKTINAKIVFADNQENASNVKVEIVEMMGKNETTDSKGNVKFEIDKPYDSNSYTFKITCPECEITTLEKYIDTTQCAYRIRETLEVKRKEKATTSSTTNTTPQNTANKNGGTNPQNSVSFGGDNNGTVIIGNENVEINNTKPKNDSIK